MTMESMEADVDQRLIKALGHPLRMSVLAILNASTYAFLAHTARGLIRKASIQRAVNRTGGTLLIAAGAVTAGYRRIAA